MKLNGRCVYDDDDHDVLTVGDVMAFIQILDWNARRKYTGEGEL